MNSKYLISKNDYEGTVKKDDFGLFVNEIFYDTIQGEGLSIGTPAVFLRLAGCTLNCVWCDTEWQKGYNAANSEIMALMVDHGIVDRLKNGHHLVITGGSPMKQQDSLIKFIRSFCGITGFLPIIEIENECTIIPKVELLKYIMYWNNSPKLRSSGMKERARYKPEVLEAFKDPNILVPRVTYKFVIADKNDWGEIYQFFIKPGFVKKSQIILMPLGATKEELFSNEKMVVSLAVEEGVRYSTRAQIVLGEL